MEKTFIIKESGQGHHKQVKNFNTEKYFLFHE
jgi:hypothetical protein